MYLPDANNIVHVNMRTADLLDGDLVKWSRGSEFDNAGIFRQYATVDVATWDKTAAAKLSIDFKINVSGDYAVNLLASTKNRECYLWIEFDGKQNEIDDSGTGRLYFPFSAGSLWFWQHTTNEHRAYMPAGNHNITIYTISNDLLIQDIRIRPVSNVSAGNESAPLSLYNTNGDASIPDLVSPKNGTTLEGSAQRFTFVANNALVEEWFINVGTTIGGNDVFDLGPFPNILGLGVTVNNLPIGDGYIYFRLWTLSAGVWTQRNDYKFRLHDPRNPKQNYVEWLEDSTNDKNRVLIVDIDHAGGTTKISSQPFLNNEDNVAYDDFIINNPFLGRSLGETIEVGDIEAVNPVLDENWLNNNYHGYKCRMYYGDVNWHKNQFRLIATATNDDVRETGDRRYIFDLVEESFKFKIPFPGYTTDFEQTLTFKDSFSYLMRLWDAAGEYQFINISDDILLRSMRFQVDANTTILDILSKLADSVNAHIRISQRGFLEVLRPDRVNQPAIKYTEDNIDSVRTASTIHAVRQITIVYDHDRLYTLPIESETASLEEELRIETYLYRLEDAQILAAELEEEYTNAQRVYEIGVVGFADLTQEGDVVTIDHPTIAGTGMVTNIDRTPLSNSSTVDVIMFSGSVTS